MDATSNNLSVGQLTEMNSVDTQHEISAIKSRVILTFTGSCSKINLNCSAFSLQGKVNHWKDILSRSPLFDMNLDKFRSREDG